MKIITSATGTHLIRNGSLLTKVPSRKGFIATGSGHHEIAFSADSRYAFVTNRDAGTVSVIDLTADRIIANVRVGARPWGIGLTSDGKFLYTANGPSNDVSVIDTASLNVVATVRVGKTPWGIAIGPAPRDD